MPDATWKAFERSVANLFGGKRRGANTSDGVNGKSDIIKSGWAIECKLLSRIGWQDCLNAVEQARRNREQPDDIAVAILKRNGDHYSHALVVMQLHDFVERFVNVEGEHDET